MKPQQALAAKAPARRARKQYAFRLPLQLAARFEALCEMYPQKTRSELLGDLLGLGLAQLEQNWPRSRAGTGEWHPDSRQPVYLVTGPFAEFRGLVHKHHMAMERELAGDEAEPLYPLDEYQLGQRE